ncbi:L-2-hydroxyglutarate oxidase [Alloacidobacterium dinghuense]|uniref:L-2-hydroxyglutarate oxidase n=1 Tax=Alloacidobacterium dinghuense TaxID=2763107 RepID=A0A7G8BLQ2_9BACT|nr:L-2-hydroxyglutarate oxidase [Alloacidobacterium dinghuense]QNI33472.1 L-2-hydroxyglutarate oxidase [Alloacidobacterium dinghuense]
MSKPSSSIAIIGGGIVGLATGLEFSKRFPGTSLSIIEKEPELARHQTGHNSGVIHSGIYYKPGSLKARLCVKGAEALVRFCQEHSVPYDICGKVVVAATKDELPRLEGLYVRGKHNGLQGLRMLCSQEILEIEPHAAGIQGIHVPSTGIVDYARVAEKYAELITAREGTIHLSHEVTGLKRNGASTVIETTQGPIHAKLVINCAGLQSDRISRLAKAELDLTIVPFRGEYYDIVPGKHHYLKGLIYPVPDPRFPFLGVHLTRRIGGGVEAGPNAVLALKREGYTKVSFRARDVFDYATFPGFWIMAAKYWRMSLSEYRRSWSKQAFVRALQRLMPEINSDDLVPNGAGVRAQALARNGTLMDDFHFVHTDGIVHVCNVPSPAATASLAIGEYIVDTVVKQQGANIGRLS